jgi:plasmid stabilization system protein ParE
MSYRIIWTAFAQYQLELVYEFACEQSPSYGDKVIEGIDLSIQQLLQFPLSGAIEQRLANLAEEYRFVVYSYFKVIYRFEPAGVIVIVSVFDTRQDPQKLEVGKV